MKTGDYEIPFDKEGNQLHYSNGWTEPSYWAKNVPFEDVLTYAAYRRGRSAAYFEFTRANGKSVTVFLKDFEGMIPRMTAGAVAGTFVFTKRGQNYGAKLVP